MKRLGLRGRLQLAVGVAVTAALVGLIGGFNLILTHVLDRDARDLVRARAVAEIDSLRTSGGQLSVREAPDDAAADVATPLPVHDAIVRDTIEGHGGCVFASSSGGFSAAFSTAGSQVAGAVNGR